MRKVLVLLSSYNGEKYIKQQINSILSQKGDFSLDILVRDDGSSDATVSILKEINNTLEKKINIVLGDNIGCNASFFALLGYATGYDYYAFSDQDDIWLDDKIQSAINMLESDDLHCPKLYGSCSFVVDNNLNKTGITTKQVRDISFSNILIQNFLPGHSQVMNQALINIINEKEMNIDNVFYYDAWISTVAAAFGKIYFDNTPHTLYRQHENNELGFGNGVLGWAIERYHRVAKGDATKTSKQIKEFLRLYEDQLNHQYVKWIKQFFNSQKNILSRLRYVISCPLYRQSKIQTFLFKLLYLLNKYSV